MGLYIKTFAALVLVAASFLALGSGASAGLHEREPVPSSSEQPSSDDRAAPAVATGPKALSIVKRIHECRCERIEAKVVDVRQIPYDSKEIILMGFKVRWTMHCSPGRRNQCEGELEVAVRNYGPRRHNIVPFKCKADRCDRPTPGTTHEMNFGVRVDELAFDHSVYVPIRYRCGKHGEWGYTLAAIAFRDGRFSPTASDLDGDGFPDGETMT